MSNKLENNSSQVSIIFKGLIICGIVYFIFCDDKSIASEELWAHFKSLSMISAGYLFGKNK